MNKAELLLRRRLIFLIVGAPMLLLWLAIVRMQWLESDVYLEKSLNNQIRPERLNPYRGLIRDRSGRLIADNQAGFSVYVTPRIVRDNRATLERISTLLQVDSSLIATKFSRLPLYSMKSFRLLRNLDFDDYTRLEEHRDQLPGVTLRSESKRFYADTTLGHVVGYLGEIKEPEQHSGTALQQGDLIGKRGLEQQYDRQLRGIPGTRFIQVDALGRELGVASEIGEQPPTRGLDLVLGIDLDLQNQAHRLLGDRSGAVLLMDCRTGEILTAVSRPDFNPNIFSSRLSQETWDRLNDAETRPLFSRIHQATHPPGSTFKLLVAGAMLEAGFDPNQTVFCGGSYQLGNRTAACWLKTGHGHVDMHQALVQSCDVYFYDQSLRLGLEPISRWARKFHFGSPTGVDLPGEKSGLVPDSSWYNQRFGRGGWTRGILLNVAIGQGEVLVTPIQLLAYTGLLANRGTLITPHFGIRLVDQQHHISFPVSYPRMETVVEESTWDFIRDAAADVVAGEKGTAHWLQRSAYTVSGKTGTAENPHGEAHSWFMAWAPAEDPQIAAVVLVEHGGHGSEVAAPIVFKLFDHWFGVAP